MIKKDKLVNEIINAVISLNKEARKNYRTKINQIINKKERIKKGRSPSLTSFFEDKFARKLKRVFPNHIFFYIDYPIRLLNKKGKIIQSQSVHPDLMIVDNTSKMLIGMIELKLDLGYLKTDELNDSRERNISRARYIEFNPIVNAYTKEDRARNTKIRLTIRPRGLIKIGIIVTECNKHDKLRKFQRFLEKHNYKVISLLDKNTHFNRSVDISKEIRKQVKNKKDEISFAFSGLLK